MSVPSARDGPQGVGGALPVAKMGAVVIGLF